uniref:Uncharacterized protein n=1 Tax=Tetranychus urticae TaxID=32264 RepID=T1KNC3_TETUR
MIAVGDAIKKLKLKLNIAGFGGYQTADVELQ